MVQQYPYSLQIFSRDMEYKGERVYKECLLLINVTVVSFVPPIFLYLFQKARVCVLIFIARAIVGTSLYVSLH